MIWTTIDIECYLLCLRYRVTTKVQLSEDDTKIEVGSFEDKALVEAGEAMNIQQRTIVALWRMVRARDD